MTGIEILDLETATKDEWLAARKIGGSDAAAICGVNPYRSRYAVWMEKLAIAAPVEETEAMTWGKVLEPIITSEFSRRTGLRIEKATKLVQHPKHHFMTATLDYLVYEGDKCGPLSIKNTSQWFDRTWERGIADPAHVQLMHELAVTGFEFGYIAALIGGNKLAWHRVERDEELITRIIDLERDFWGLVQTRTPPALSSTDGDILLSQFPESDDDEVILTESAQVLISEYEEAKRSEKLYSDRAETAANKLKAMLGPAERGRVGSHVVSWKTVKSSRLDSKAIQRDHADICAKYLKESSSRRFTVKNEGEDNGEE